MASFKEMIREGTIKRADAMKLKLEDIHVEPDFNVRIPGAELEAHIESIKDFILAGGQLPALEVRPRDEGGVWVVDGHCRREGYRRAVEAGAPIEWVEVRAFQGNDIDRVARIATSNEGLKLSQLEVAMLYKKLRGMGLEVPEIARNVNKTRQHVEATLKLADANRDVQQMVAKGDVSPGVAIDMVRRHGEKAGEKLKETVEKVKAAGKTKVTKAAVAAPKPAWHPAPTIAGLWAWKTHGEGADDKSGIAKVGENDLTRADINAAGYAWFGPLPEINL